MKKNKKLVAMAIAALSFAPPTFAYTIDGNLADWGLQTNWSVSAPVKASAVEDQTGSTGTYLNPGWGGQQYDAEAMYLDWDGTNVYIAIVTGLSPNTLQNPGNNSYGPGDILFNFGADGNYDFGLVLTSIASLTSGAVYSISSPNGTNNLNYGLWSSPQNPGLAPNPYPVAVKAGAVVGTGTFAYPNTAHTGYGSYPGDTHYFIEAGIPVSAFGAFWGANGPTQNFHVQWGAYCANDVIGVDPRAHVPEPGSLLLAALGLGALAGFQRRRARRA